MSFRTREKDFRKAHPELPADLRRIWAVLETVRTGVAEIHDSLPPTAEELALGDMGSQEPVAMRVRADLRCLLADAIEPGLRSLWDLANSLSDHPVAPPARP